ncbi:MAG: metallophosphoesterase family protein [Acutalibacteraceae bacterium]
MKNKTLQFRKDGSFKILQLTDIHGIYRKTPDTTKLIEAVLDLEKPDLVVFTGDQIKGYCPSYLTGDKTKKVEQAIDNYIESVNSRGIPFIVTFGNHDPQVGISNADQMKMYRQFDCCLRAEDGYEYDAGTYSIPIMSRDGSTQAFNIYMIDSGGNAKGGGYDAVQSEKVAWYRSVRDKLYEKWGRYIPAFVFQHIPVHEIYNLYDKVDKNHPDAIRAFRTHKGEFYKLKDEFTNGNTKLHEPSSIPDINTGEFEAVREKGDVIAMFFGHDHMNNFVGTYDGVDLGYSPSCGFNEYGNGVERGIRVFELHEDDIRHYDTHVVTYHQLFGEKVLNPLRKAFYDHIPTSFEAAIPLIVKGVLGLVALVALIVFLIIYF